MVSHTCAAPHRMRIGREICLPVNCSATSSPYSTAAFSLILRRFPEYRKLFAVILMPLKYDTGHAAISSSLSDDDDEELELDEPEDDEELELDSSSHAKASNFLS